MRTRAYRLRSRERRRRDTQASTLCRLVLTRCGADSNGDSNGISQSQPQTHASPDNARCSGLAGCDILTVTGALAATLMPLSPLLSAPPRVRTKRHKVHA